MSNQHFLSYIAEEDRQRVLDLYAQGLGVERIVNEVPQGRELVRRILREANVLRMRRGNQTKFKPICPDNKVCPTCGIEKDKKEFGAHSCQKDGLRSQCKTCRAELERPGQLMRKYGITAEEYDRMYQAQDGRCACCGQPETALHWKGKKRTLAIDHDHIM